MTHVEFFVKLNTLITDFRLAVGLDSRNTNSDYGWGGGDINKDETTGNDDWKIAWATAQIKLFKDRIDVLGKDAESLGIQINSENITELLKDFRERDDGLGNTSWGTC